MIFCGFLIVELMKIIDVFASILVSIVFNESNNA